MTRFDKLKREARQAATYRGHRLSPFRTLKAAGVRKVGRAACPCGMDVQVETHPAPNSIDIGGEAVALNCHRLF